mmetsp:Transcript_32103/g.83603  ORF Transcript_32103/g.83603 Transcript_32103/m.83603 type:complete len:230 (+) Transcript_32103:265-954(+)
MIEMASTEGSASSWPASAITSCRATSSSYSWCSSSSRPLNSMLERVRSAHACAAGEAMRNRFFRADSSASSPQSLSKQLSRHCPMSSTRCRKMPSKQCSRMSSRGGRSKHGSSSSQPSCMWAWSLGRSHCAWGPPRELGISASRSLCARSGLMLPLLWWCLSSASQAREGLSFDMAAAMLLHWASNPLPPPCWPWAPLPFPKSLPPIVPILSPPASPPEPNLCLSPLQP